MAARRTNRFILSLGTPNQNKFINEPTPETSHSKDTTKSEVQRQKNDNIKNDRIPVRDISEIVPNSSTNTPQNFIKVKTNVSTMPEIIDICEETFQKKVQSDELLCDTISISSEDYPKTPKIRKTQIVLTDKKITNNKKKKETLKSEKSKQKNSKSKSEIKKSTNENLEGSLKCKTEEKFKRKLTKSTNLKTFSYKHHPQSQTKIQHFFVKTAKGNSIGYFETFENSRQKQKKNYFGSNIENFDVYLGDLLAEFKIKSSVGKLSTPNENPVNKIGINDDNYNLENVSTESSKTCLKSNLNHIKINNDSSMDVKSSINQNKSNNCNHSYSLRKTTTFNRKFSDSKQVKSNKIEFSKLSIQARKRLSFEFVKSRTESTSKYLENDIDFKSLLPTGNIEETCKKKTEINNIIEISDDDSLTVSENFKQDSIQFFTSSNLSNKKNVKRRKSIDIPSYKIVDGTTFAVDAFRFGDIEGITHYFLSHYHGDHYIGLRKTFCKPIFMSSITARLVKTFINVRSEYLNIIDPDESVIINGVEVTAIDANHCPGAVMFAFKISNENVILHTGDFRACHEMESNPYFWNNQIHTIYLDTTYLHKNYDFKSQSESIEDVRFCINQFQEKHIEKKILYICGSYVIGKEKVWAAIAELTGKLVYTKGNRSKALHSIGDFELMKYLVNDPKLADIHVLTMSELFYDKLYQYWKLYEDQFDIMLAIRPSGWERNSKPQYRGVINIVGIEYSEHSSCSELRRFVRFLQPKQIISTVPFGSDLSKTCKIPISWYDNQIKPKQKPFQQSITNFIESWTEKKENKNTNLQKSICSKDLNDSQYENLVSPIKSVNSTLIKVENYKLESYT